MDDNCLLTPTKSSISPATFLPHADVGKPSFQSSHVDIEPRKLVFPTFSAPVTHFGGGVPQLDPKSSSGKLHVPDQGETTECGSGPISALSQQPSDAITGMTSITGTPPPQVIPNIDQQINMNELEDMVDRDRGPKGCESHDLQREIHQKTYLCLSADSVIKLHRYKNSVQPRDWELSSDIEPHCHIQKSSSLENKLSSSPPPPQER